MTRRGTLIVAVAVGALLLGRVQLGEAPAAQDLPAQEPGVAERAGAPRDPAASAEGRRARGAGKPRQQSAPAPAAPRAPRPRTQPRQPQRWLVVSVVDGDTIDVQRAGEYRRVRVIGIDTPERGECGYGEASSALSHLVLDRRVQLSRGAVDDRDRYGRLLRYVDVGGQDAGLALIDGGLAIARYDSRDGYGAHPREATYVTADAATPSAVCREDQPAPIAEIPKPASGSGGAFENCTAARAAGAAPVHRGDPGYGSHLDGDDDGVGCE